jgi:dTDP-4-dehydrorhamnose reductase
MDTKILVTGSNGQLGKSLQALSNSQTGLQFIFAGKDELQIDLEAVVAYFFERYQPDFCINTAAYTAVDKAETEQEPAFAANTTGPRILAETALRYNCKLIHISTDYVFDGKKNRPYLETDSPNPLNYYGYTKWKGEQQVLSVNPDSLIFRTSWVYSPFGSNFVKTMLRLMATNQKIRVVNDQVGSPTNAFQLAATILRVINQLKKKNVNHHGIYHYSSETAVSWYDFALEIKDQIQSHCIIEPITTKEFPTPAARSAYSVLDKSKIKQDFAIEFTDWKTDLKNCIYELQNQQFQ